jgi:hypothetical protein
MAPIRPLENSDGHAGVSHGSLTTVGMQDSDVGEVSQFTPLTQVVENFVRRQSVCLPPESRGPSFGGQLFAYQGQSPQQANEHTERNKNDIEGHPSSVIEHDHPTTSCDSNRLGCQREGIVMLAMLQHDVGKHLVDTVGRDRKRSTVCNVHGRQTFRSSVERNRLVATLEECGIHIRRDHPRTEVREGSCHTPNSTSDLKER